jgi:tRNA dimethylallyltransferase
LNSDLPKLVVILGPTACGKSELACKLAGDFDFEIINADSLQIYIYFDIGTAKPPLEILNSNPHHLIDIVKPDSEFNAGIFRKHAKEIIESLVASDKKILVVGGTYLYVRVLTEGLIEGVEPDSNFREQLKTERYLYGNEYIYKQLMRHDPESVKNIAENDYVRIERALEVYHLTGMKMSQLQKEHNFEEKRYNILKIGIDVERECLIKIIENRLNKMFEDGFIDEVVKLRDMGFSKNLKPMQSIGYKEINDYLDGLISFETAKEKILINTRRLAKRQMTWLKRDKDIRWYKLPDAYTQIVGDINQFYKV